MKQSDVEQPQQATKKSNIETPLISIVDDDPSVRVSTLRLLRWSGFRAEAFDCAEAFLSSEYLAQTNCLVLDVRMPGMDGLELQKRLMDTGRRIPIVFLSARASEEEKQRALRVGAAGFLRKPVSKEILLRTIHSVLGPPAPTDNNPPKEL